MKVLMKILTGYILIPHLKTKKYVPFLEYADIKRPAVDADAILEHLFLFFTPEEHCRRNKQILPTNKHEKTSSWKTI